MFFETEAREYHSAIVDVTDRCNLRCRHCFYYREEHPSEDLSVEDFLGGIETLKDRHHIMHMSWSGGEPLLRPDIVIEGSSLFMRTVLNTNGTLPVPRIPNQNVYISIDGPPAIHDYIRGKGVYQKVMENIEKSKLDRVIFCCTVNKRNVPYLEEMIEGLVTIKNSAFLLALFTPLKSYKKIARYPYSDEQRAELGFSWDERDRVLDDLLRLKRLFPGYILNPDKVIELMASKYTHDITSNCNMPHRSLALDVKLDRKLPCVVSTGVDCNYCGCFFPYLTEALRLKDPKSQEFFEKGYH
jgi:Fe-coproporphyrin III synthase